MNFLKTIWQDWKETFIWINQTIFSFLVSLIFFTFSNPKTWFWPWSIIDFCVLVLVTSFCSFAIAFALPALFRKVALIAHETNGKTLKEKHAYSTESGFILVSWIAGAWFFFVQMVNFFPEIEGSKKVYFIALIANVFFHLSIVEKMMKIKK